MKVKVKFYMDQNNNHGHIKCRKTRNIYFMLHITNITYYTFNATILYVDDLMDMDCFDT